MHVVRFIRWLLSLIFPPRDTERVIEETSDEAFLALLSPQVTDTGAIALFPYRHPLVRAAIVEAKFKRNPRAIALLAAALREYLDAYQEETNELGEGALTLTVIPLAKMRRHERGYNQVEEVALRAGYTPTPLLTRIRDTVPQTTLTRKQRLLNMEGAFEARDIPAGTVIVLDDVVTTGATLAAAATALRAQRFDSFTLLALSA